MDIFAAVANAVIVLLIAVVAFSVAAVFFRWRSDLRQLPLRRARTRMQEALQGFLNGACDRTDVVNALGKNSEIALAALVSCASELPPGERPRLNDLFLHFGFARKEIEGLHDRSWARRARAANHLGYIGDHSAVPGLIAALNDDMLDVRLAAAHALAQLGATEAVAPILRSLALPAEWPLQRAVETLHAMGDSVVDPLLVFLNQPAPFDAQSAVALRVLGMRRAAHAAPSVRRFLSHATAELRVCSARTLGQIGDVPATAALCEALADPVWEVRNAAAIALGTLRQTSAIPALAKALSDPAWWVRFNAAEALRVTDSQGLEILKDAMLNHTDAFARDISRQVLEQLRNPPQPWSKPA
ncbi:MAG: HEAT repeat domain-containing protein [Pseudomonadota bacterium]